MAELLDRAFQKELLRDLLNLYPKSADLKRSYGPQTDNRLLVNLSYLHEHGLITLSASTLLDGEVSLHSAKITADGLDFIADDGGLTAILGVVTVKLHQDTIRDLLVAKIEKSAAPKSVKDRLIDQIKSLPADVLSTVTTKALESGLDHMPDIVGWLQTLLHRGKPSAASSATG